MKKKPLKPAVFLLGAILALGLFWLTPLTLPTTPALAAPCTILASEAYVDPTTGEGYYTFAGTCPPGFQGSYSLFVDGNKLADGSGETVIGYGGPYAEGSHTVELYCRNDAATITDACTTTFTVEPPTPPPPPPPPPGPTGDIPKLSELADLVKRLIQVLLALGGLAAFVYLLIGGFKYLTAEGDEKLLMSAKQTLTYAILGLIFVVASWLIINTIIQMIGPVEVEDVIIETPTFRIP